MLAVPLLDRHSSGASLVTPTGTLGRSVSSMMHLQHAAVSERPAPSSTCALGAPPSPILHTNLPADTVMSVSSATAAGTAASGTAQQPQPPDPQTARKSTFDCTVEGAAGEVITVPKGLVRRPVLDVRNLDLHDYDKAKGLDRFKRPAQIGAETVIAVLVLFNAVSTLMIINTTFAQAVPASERNAFGSPELFQFLTSMVTYSPLAFLLIVVFMANNAYSELAFYSCLKRWCILDFPASGHRGFILTSGMGIGFLLFFAWYLALSLGTFFVYRASVGVVVIFCNNLLIGVGLAWYRQQSIESKFISVSDFIQAFPDREGEYGNIDEVSLHWAAEFLRGITLAESDTASFRSRMRRHMWRLHGMPESKKVLHHVGVFGTIFILAGICIAYFQILQSVDAKQRWTDRIDPCARACAGAAERAASAWAVAINPSTFTSQATCHDCICTCIKSMGYLMKEALADCPEHDPTADIRFCNGPRPVCPTSCM